MKISKIIIYVVAVSILFTSLGGCTKKEDAASEESDTISESNGQSLTDDSQISESGKTTSQVDIPDDEARLEEQVDEVREVFMSLQEVCKADDIEGYLDFWDDETKMAVDNHVRETSLGLDERRENRRKLLAKKPGTLQEIANLKIESITVNTREVEKIETVFGVEIEGTMMLVETNGKSLLFHETAKGWKLFSINMPKYFNR